MADQSTEKKRNTAMRWQKLGADKDPEFGIQYLLFGNKGNNEKPIEDYQVGALAEINVQPEGKKFSWFIEGEGDDQRNHFTHFALCVKPVE